MDVIGFLCVSLGSSTVQLHASLGSRRACACSEAGFNSQNGYRAWGCTTEDQRSVVCVYVCVCFFFLWAKWLNAKDIYKEIISVYGGKCLSRKAVQTGSRNSLKVFRKSQMMADQVQKLLRRQPKDFYATSFDALVKRWDKCISVGRGYVEK
jgi:hypothetical protein